MSVVVNPEVRKRDREASSSQRPHSAETGTALDQVRILVLGLESTSDLLDVINLCHSRVARLESRASGQ